MISIELLSKVLNRKIRDIEYQNGEMQEYYDEDENCGDGLWIDDFDIHEIASKCKEWIFDQGYDNVNSGYNAGVRSGRKMIVCNIKKFRGYMKQNDLDFDGDTEPEAIFKAGEWVLKEES